MRKKMMKLLITTIVVSVVMSFGLIAFSASAKENASKKWNVTATDMTVGGTASQVTAWGGAPNDPYCLVLDDGTGVMPGVTYAVAMKVTLPEDGKVSGPDWTFAKKQAAGGDKERVRVMLNDQVIVPATGDWVDLEYDVNKSLGFSERTVKKGDILWYIVDNGGAGDNTYGNVFWCPAINLNGKQIELNKEFFNTVVDGENFITDQLTSTATTFKRKDVIGYQYVTVAEDIPPIPVVENGVFLNLSELTYGGGAVPAAYGTQYNGDDWAVILAGSSDNIIPGKQFAVGYCFTVPSVATIHTEGTFSFAQRKALAKDEDSVRISVVLNNKVIFPTDGTTWYNVPTGAAQGIVYPDQAVQPGDKLYYLLDNGGNGNAAGDQCSLSMGFHYIENGKTYWYDSSSGFYTDAVTGDVKLLGDAGAEQYRKSDLLSFHYGLVYDAAMGAALDESGLVEVEALAKTEMSFATDRYQANDDVTVQIEKDSMSLNSKHTNIIDLKLPSNGKFAFKNTFLKVITGEARFRVLKNSKQIYPQSGYQTITTGYQNFDQIGTIDVVANDVLSLQVKGGAEGGFIRCTIGGVLTNGTASNLLISSENFGSETAFTYSSSKPVDPLGDASTETLKDVPYVTETNMNYNLNDNKWYFKAPPSNYSMIWKATASVHIHTDNIDFPTISFLAPAAGKIQAKNLTFTVSSAQSDGVRVRILLKKGTMYSQVFPLDQSWQTLLNGEDLTSFDSSVFEVAENDEFMIVFDPNNTATFDETKINFDMAFQKAGENTQLYNVFSTFATTQNTVWRYKNLNIQKLYENITVPVSVAREFTTLKQDKIIVEEMGYRQNGDKYNIIGYQWLHIKNGEMHPDATMGAATVMTMPNNGRLWFDELNFQLADFLSKPDADGIVSDGVRVRIMKNNQVVYPADGTWKLLDSSKKTKMTIDAFDVQKNDKIYIVVDCNKKMNYDLTYFTAVAHFAETGSAYTKTFDSKRDFAQNGIEKAAFSYVGIYFDETPDVPVVPDKPGDGDKEDDKVQAGCKGGCGTIGISGGAGKLGGMMVLGLMGVIGAYFFKKKRWEN